MARNGAGTYSLPAGNPVVTGTVISSTTQNNTMTDVATALTQSLAYDGQTLPIANLPMGTYRHTGVGNGVARTDYLAVGQVQDGFGVYASVGGTADAITLTTSPVTTAYAAGQTFRFIASGANTTAVTVNVNAIGAVAITKGGSTALAAGDIPSGAIVQITYDGTRFQAVLINITQAAADLRYAALAGLSSQTFSVATGTTVNHAMPVGQFQSGAPTFAAGGGTGDAITATFSPVPTLVNGMIFRVTAPSANTVTAPTFNPNGTGALTIFKQGNQALAVGDIRAGDHELLIEYRSSGPARYELLNPYIAPAATTAETQTGTSAIKYVTPASLLGAIGFSAYYASPDQTITAAGALVLAHGLGRTPILIINCLRCVTAEGGYSIGDVVFVNTHQNSFGAVARGVAVNAGSTNLDIRYGSTATTFEVLNQASGVIATLTNANWSYFVRAWA